MDEIVSAARARMRADDEFTMRAIASDVGLTGPGLYRYVKSLDELRTLIVHRSVDEACAHIQLVAACYDHPHEKILAAATALRTWAMANPAEFRLGFASPTDVTTKVNPKQLASLAQRIEVDALTTAGNVGPVFAPMFAALLASEDLDVRGHEHLSAEFAAEKPALDTERMYPELTEIGGPSANWIFLYLWSRLYGAIAFEVFNHIEPQTIAAAVFFRTAIVEMAADLHIRFDRKRADEIIDAEIARRPQRL